MKTYGSCTQTELCEYLDVEAPTMTRNIKRLEQMGLIKRVTGKDHRKNIVELTSQALKQYPIWEQAANQLEEELLKELSKQKHDIVENITKNLIRKFKYRENK
ncbi:MarR family transcriptional regulator [Priestia megaterium]|nr:MarR family transcriptional regulator [Priestia megaterium]